MDGHFITPDIRDSLDLMVVVSQYMQELGQRSRICSPRTGLHPVDESFFLANPKRRCFIRRSDYRDNCWLTPFIVPGFSHPAEAYILSVKITEDSFMSKVIMPGSDLVEFGRRSINEIRSDNECMMLVDMCEIDERQKESNGYLLLQKCRQNRQPF